MPVFKRNKATGGFNISTKGGAVRPLYRMPTEGLGKANTEEFFEKVGSKNILEMLNIFMIVYFFSCKNSTNNNQKKKKVK